MSILIPPNAKKVFKGRIFDVYQWDQEMYDGTRMVFEHLKRADTAIVIPITEDKQIIMQEEEQPHKPIFLTFCAGKVEEGETPGYAAKRELLEETGYEAGELVSWFVENPISKIDWNIYIFIAKKCKKKAEQDLENGEKIKLLLVNFEEFIDKVLEDRFHNQRIKIEVLKAKLDPAKMQGLKKLFFD